jgi:hypothetical protein
MYLRVYAKFIPSAGVPDPSAYADQLAKSLGLGDGSVLAIYFADRDGWTLHLGRDLVGSFTGSHLDPDEQAKNGSLAAATAAFLRMSDERAVGYSAQSRAVLPNLLQTSGQHIKISVDAVLDELIEKLVQHKQLT